MKKKFFLTTAIDYVNAAPHLGHALEKVQTDIIARYHRHPKFLNEDVLFLSGTDENSLKNVQSARKEGISTEKLVNRNSEIFSELRKDLNLSYDDFIRTTEERHIKGAQKLWSACQNDIYTKKYQGLYCVGCEEFYKEKELINGFCPEHKTKPEIVEEENYFFKLSKYQNQLKKIIEEDEVKIIPQTRKNEVLSFINQGLDDICISRSAERASGWGIDVPGDSSQKLWVWFDALSNYINAVDYATNEKEFEKWWPADLHVIGKGILRFHAIYWPAILLSANLALPKEIFVHGYLTVDGQKMSKSLGNVIDPFELVKKYDEDYGTDAVRYFLLREIPSTKDGDFTYKKFEERYNSDLAKGIGNLVARVRTMADSQISFKEDNISVIEPEIKKTRENYTKALERFEFNEALKAIWNLISFSDKYIEKERPWEKPWDNNLKSQRVLGCLLVALDNIAELLSPFLPETSEKIIKEIQRNKESGKFKTKEKGKLLFPKI